MKKLSGKRIIIFAPHPDDEVLASGGYLFTAAKNHARIKVVIATSGESFGYALGKTLGNFLPLSQKCQKFALLRQQEAENILGDLGVKKEDIIFLGFPDKGLKSLLRKNFSRNKPYFSPLLRRERSPLENIYQKEVLFAGEELLRLLAEIIRAFKPQIIIMPSSYDDHPDHQALNQFIKKALGHLGIFSKGATNLQLYSFLIHKKRFLYPLPFGLRPEEELAPPLGLRKKNISWYKFPLSREAFLAKEKAILSYKTQMRAMPQRLLSFLRKNELFEKINLSEA